MLLFGRTAKCVASFDVPSLGPIIIHPSSPDPSLCAQTNFQTWNDALQTKNHKTVANLYSTNDLSFLPTVSPQHIKALPNAEDYFKDFVLKNPFGTITDDKVQVFDDGNTYLHSGY